MQPSYHLVMASTTRARAYKPRPDRTGLPLIEVECTGCGHRFTPAARTHTRCPECGRNLRVHRSPRARRVPGVQPRPEKQIRPAPVRQASVFPPLAPPPPTSLARAVIDQAEDDDDGLTYCISPSGQLVPAVWNGSAWIPAAPTVLPSPVDKHDLRLAVRTEAERRRLASLGLIVSDTASPGFCAVQQCPGDGDGLYRHYRWWLCDGHYGRALTGRLNG